MNRVKTAIRILATGIAVVLVAGCGQTGPRGTEQLEKLASGLSIQQVGWVRISGGFVALRYVKDGSWQTAYQAGSSTRVWPEGGQDFAWQPVPMAALKVATLQQKIDTPPGAAGCRGEVGMARGGSRVTWLDCGYDSFSTAIDDKELSEIGQWDEAGFDQTLGELQQVNGPESQLVTFVSPNPESETARGWLRSVSPAITGVSGHKCTVSVTRLAVAPQSSVLEIDGCDDRTWPGSESFSLAELSGAELVAAMAEATASMGIPVDGVRQFDVLIVKGKLVMQVFPDKGMYPQARSVTVAVGP